MGLPIVRIQNLSDEKAPLPIDADHADGLHKH